jgi:signal transduction histidine kinase/ligand-binding sensor domain-containing protein
MLMKHWTLAAMLLWGALDSGASAAGGVRYSVTQLGAREGIISVTAMTQTRDGYLWLGTPYGLVRFDGYRFTTFDDNNTPGLGGNRIFHVFEDSRSNLWVGTETDGIKLIKEGRVISVPAAGVLKSACEDSSGGVWLYTDNGYLLRYHDGKVDVGDGGTNLFSNCRMIIAEKDGPVWMATDSGLHSSGKTPPQSLVGPPSELVGWVTNVNFLLASARGGFWCLADGRVQRWGTNGMDRDSWAYPWDQKITPVSSACEDHDGNLVVGTYDGGVFWFDAKGTATRITRAQGLSADNVFSVVVDQDGSLWVGTDGGGLNRVKPCLFDAFNNREKRTVQSVCQDREGGLWVGYNGSFGAVQYWKDGAKQQQFGTNQGLLVKSMFVARDGKVWAGTWGPWDQWLLPVLPAGGLFNITGTNIQASFIQAVVQQGTNQSVMIQFIQSVSAIYQDRHGLLWAGTKGGLAAQDGSNWKMLTASNGLSSSDVRALVDDAEGNLWIGTDGGGLNCLREGRFTKFDKQDGLPSDHITSLLVDHEGTLWVGTFGGLARHSKGGWTRYTTDDGLISNTIGYLLEDDQGFLWIGSNLGLMRIEKNALNKFAENSTNVFTCRVYEETDGLPSSFCTSGSQPAACRTADGKLWFPTIKGLAVVEPAKISRNLKPPPVTIESVSIGGQAQGTTRLRARVPERIVVPASSEHLDIQYTSLNLAAADKTRFRYIMERFEEKPNEAGNRRVALYSKLPPGNYQFRVTAGNEDGVWNDTGATLTVIVLPPFWQKWWFRGVVSACLLGIIVAIVHYISTQKLHRQLAGLRQQQALEKERSRIARDIHDQLGASLTQVSLLGELVESDKDSPGEVEAHARQISQTARDTTRVLDEIVWTVNPSNDTLDGLVTYVCKYAQEYLAVAGLRYRLEAPNQLPDAVVSPEVRHNVFLAVKEAITNVVRHAHASAVWVRLRLAETSFTLEIQDDGRGIPNIEEKKAGSRNGLRNMGKRMEDLGGKFDIVPATGGGTLVRLTVPIKHR